MARYTIVENGYYQHLRHQLPWLVVHNFNGYLVARFASFIDAVVFCCAGNYWEVARIDWTVLP